MPQSLSIASLGAKRKRDEEQIVTKQKPRLEPPTHKKKNK